MEFPSDLDVSDAEDDEDGEGEAGGEGKKRAAPRTNGKAPAPGLGKRKGPAKEKKGGKQREFIALSLIRGMLPMRSCTCTIRAIADLLSWRRRR